MSTIAIVIVLWIIVMVAVLGLCASAKRGDQTAAMYDDDATGLDTPREGL